MNKDDLSIMRYETCEHCGEDSVGPDVEFLGMLAIAECRNPACPGPEERGKL
jgi:hypothetical protein